MKWTAWTKMLMVLTVCLSLAPVAWGAEMEKSCTLSPLLENPEPVQFDLAPLVTGVFTVHIETPAGYDFLGAGPAVCENQEIIWTQIAEWKFVVMNAMWNPAHTRVSLEARWKRQGGGGGSGGGGVIKRKGIGDAYMQMGDLLVLAEPPVVPVGEPAQVAAYASGSGGSPAVSDWTVAPEPQAWFVGGSLGLASVQVQRNTPGEALVSAVYTNNLEKTGDATVTFVAVTGISAQPAVVGVGGQVNYGITTEPPGYGWLVSYVPADVSTPGVKTVTAVCGNSSVQCSVTVVGIKRMVCADHHVESETDDPDEPETVYVAWTNSADEYVEWVAEPEPAVGWPEGWPAWEGAEPDAENPSIARVPRNQATLSVHDAVVRASCGASAKAGRTIVARLNLEYDNLPEEWAVPPGVPNEEVPGGFLGVNDNDNAGGTNPGEGNGTPDNQDPTPLAHADPDLRPLRLSLQPSDMEHGVVTLNVPDEGGPLRAWADGKKNATPKTWSIDEGERPPAEVYLEGYAPGVATVSLAFDHADKLALEDAVNLSALKVEITPESGPIGTKLTIKILPLGLNLFSDSTIASASGRFHPVPANLGVTTEATLNYLPGQIHYDPTFPDQIQVAVGDVMPPESFFTSNPQVILANGGSCQMDVTVNASEVSCMTTFTFTLIPEVALGTVIGNFFTPVTTFSPGQELRAQVLIKDDGLGTAPSTIKVTVQSYDDNGEPITLSAPDSADPSHTITLMKLTSGGTQGFHTYWSDESAPIVPWPYEIMPTTDLAGRVFIYYVMGGKLEVDYVP